MWKEDIKNLGIPTGDIEEGVKILESDRSPEHLAVLKERRGQILYEPISEQSTKPSLQLN
jgi:hypothetical protein